MASELLSGIELLNSVLSPCWLLKSILCIIIVAVHVWPVTLVLLLVALSLLSHTRLLEAAHLVSRAIAVRPLWYKATAAGHLTQLFCARLLILKCLVEAHCGIEVISLRARVLSSRSLCGQSGSTRAVGIDHMTLSRAVAHIHLPDVGLLLSALLLRPELVEVGHDVRD